MRSAKTTLILLVLASQLTACGLKGALYLPDDEQTSQAAAELTAENKNQMEHQEQIGGDDIGAGQTDEEDVGTDNVSGEDNDGEL